MVALNERLPDAYKLLPPAGQPGPGEGQRRSLHQVVADRRAARAAQYAGPPPSRLAEWLADRQRHSDQQAERVRAGAVGERQVAEALRIRATGPDPEAGRYEHSEPPAERKGDRQEQERDASPRTTSATVGTPTGSAPTTSARSMAERCRSRHHGPSRGCR
jgi:hypothetical protein